MNIIGTQVRDLKILSEIGEGGMGVVFLAEHVMLGKIFALKCLSPALSNSPHFGERFGKEARAQAALNHPNIVQVNDFFEDNGRFYLSMEYVDGQPLDEIIDHAGGLPEKRVLLILKDILNGLNFAHSKGIIHRDIKPSNILIDKSGRAKIMDFGIAIRLGDHRLTRTGTDIGTAWYISPEQVVTPKTVDHRSDVYSIGIVLYEMLTGQVPFDGETDYTVKDKHVRETPPDINKINPKISNELIGIVMKALEKSPDDRFDGCGEFLEYVEAYENQGDRKISPGVGSVPEDVSITIDSKDTGEEEERVRREAAVRTRAIAAIRARSKVQAEARMGQNAKTESFPEIDVDSRILCSDESCTGIMGPDGRCTECGGRLKAAGPDALQELAVKLEESQPPEPTFTDPVTGMEFVYVDSGKFIMGDSCGDEENAEIPTYEVELDGFYIGKYPVTCGQWENLMGTNPSKFIKGNKYPLETVSWDNAQNFIEKLTAKNNRQYQFRLPSEAEWEYAARSGGKKEKYAGGDDIDSVAWYDKNSGNATHLVGKKTSNGIGIHDTTGNIWEWCHDWFGDYPSGAVKNPSGPSAGKQRVLRGGSWESDIMECRSTYRYKNWPEYSHHSWGFRLVRDMTPPEPLSELSVASFPKGASIWIDGKDTGEKTDALIEIPAGNYKLELRLNAFKNARRDVEVTLDSLTEVESRLEKAPPRVAVKKTTRPKKRAAAIVITAAVFLCLALGLLFYNSDPQKERLNPSEMASKYKNATEDTVPEHQGDQSNGFKPLTPENIAKSKLFVETEPKNAWVMFPDIKQSFYQGMALKPGRYHIEVSRDGYNTKKMWVNLKAGEDKRVQIRLEQLQASIQPTPTYPRPSSTSNVINRDGIYVAYANGIVRDTNTGLEWKAGPDKDTNWDEARSWVQSLNLDGGGWRLPTRDELEGLYKKGASKSNMTPLLKTNGWRVWSGETKGSSLACPYNFYGGNWNWNFRGSSNNLRVFAVRSRGDGLKVRPYKTIRGNLFVKTDPKDSNVSILNIKPKFYQGMGLKPGKYLVEVSSEGHRTKKEWVELEDGKDKALQISLERVKNKLFVETEPKDSRVKLLNIEQKFRQGIVLKPGRYHIEVSSDGYNTKKMWVNLKTGEDQTIQIHLESAPISQASNETGENKPHGRYIAYPNGVVWDTNTGLEWKAGPDRSMGWDQARSWVKSLNTDSSVWRMPTANELRTLYKKGAGSRNTTPLLKATDWEVWTGETRHGGEACSFDFKFGKRQWHHTSYWNNLQAFAVRSRSDG